MDNEADAELVQVARDNQAAFDATLESYVGQKLAYALRRLTQGEREVWFDATDCIWCVFDDPAFERCEEGVARAKGSSVVAAGTSASCDLQVYWSLGDVVMPPACDATWVAQRIAQEAARQLRAKGYRCSVEERPGEDGPHRGVVVRRPVLLNLIKGTVPFIRFLG